MVLIEFTPDQLQHMLASDVSLFPVVYKEFLTHLKTLERRHQVCLLPIAHLDLYNMDLCSKLPRCYCRQTA